MTNVQLSADEMQLVTNREWILTKHRIIEKVYRLFGTLSDNMQVQVQQENIFLPPEVLEKSPKISKGEQYEALPYVVLDYPRFFSKEDVFAIRCFFWWGNYFSITLHLKGTFLRQYAGRIAMAAIEKQLGDFYFSTQGNEFNFNLLADEYRDSTIHRFPTEKIAEGLFLKISYKISFEHWDLAEQKLAAAFERLITITGSKRI